jgi:ribonucleoside-diphosphate reductase alpha chain
MKIQEWLGEDNKLGQDIWENKYQYNDETFDDWLDRVANNDDELRQLIVDKKFLFGGRILANRGLQHQGKKVTFSNCYVLSPPEDNIESIFDTAKNLARTFSFGGGCGLDISKLSPRGTLINNTAKETSGAVSFMDLYSKVTELIGQNGRRK